MTDTLVSKAVRFGYAFLAFLNLRRRAMAERPRSARVPE